MKGFKEFLIVIVLTSVLSFPILFVASKVFIPKWIDHDGNMMSFIIKGFYEEPKDSLDVIFLGNSDVYRAVSPMEIYNQTGITGYNFVSAGQRMWISYPMLEDALKRQNPKIIFLNVDSLFYTSNASIGNYHKVYDNMPFSFTKIKGVFDKNYELENDVKFKHFLPIVTYHNRYGELSSDDFKYAFSSYMNPTKGMDLVYYQEPYIVREDTYYMNYSDEVANIPEKNLKYLDQMVELCKSKDIELVLMEVPSADSWNYKKANAIMKYVEDKDIVFLDLNTNSAQEKMNFDWSTDTSDGGDHLNMYGAFKVSSYLAEYLSNHYDFTSHKEEEKYAYWNEQYEEYLRIKEYELENK